MEFTTVKTIVESCPEFLATKQSGCLPCHHAAYYAKASSYKYLKLYIDIGVKHNIGGEESRGCLLESNGTCITLCIISDSQLFEVFRKISPPLFYIEDIQKYHLLHNAINVHYACYDLAKYFCNLDPSSVFQRNEDNQLPIHCIVENDSDGMREEDEEYIWNMTGYLIQASLSHSPSDETIGGLFAISRDYTICIIDNDQMGTENTWNLVEKALSKYKELDNMPCILHQIIRHTPQYCDEVIKRFPNSVHVQDKNNMNRLPIHVALETGMEWSLELEYLIATGHEYLKDVDPVTKCPPFLLAGMGRESSCDLRVIYDLLHKHPEHVEMMEDGSGYKYIMLEENHKKRRIE